MNYLLKKIFGSAAVIFAFFCMGPVGANGGGFDVTKPMLCAISKAIECSENVDCAEIALKDMNMPRFIIVDPEKKEIHPAGPGASEKSSKIERQEHVDGKLMLQGAEDGVEGVRDGLGWTIAVSDTSGEFVLTASGEKAAFVVFGACTAKP
jgi:hypothetical protein